MTVTLRWTAVATPALPLTLWYNIYRATTSGGPYQLAATNCTATSYVDGPANLDPTQTYFYTVTSQTQDGESAFSVEQVATPPSGPGVPIGVSATIT